LKAKWNTVCCGINQEEAPWSMPDHSHRTGVACSGFLNEGIVVRENQAARKVLLLGFTLTDDDYEALANRGGPLLAQTQNFASNLQRSLQSAGFVVNLVSFAPVPNYPAYRQVFFRSRNFQHQGDTGLVLGFVNLLLLKHVSRFVMLRAKAMSAIQIFRPSVIIVHGVHTPLLGFALALKRKLGATAIAVLTDPPGVVLEKDGLVVRSMRLVDTHRVKRLVRRFDRVVTLTADLAEVYAPDVPSLLFPGFAPEFTKRSKHRGTYRNFTVGYAGGHSEEYGAADLVRAFVKISDPRMRLEIFGSGPLTPWVRDQAQSDSRIRVHNFVERAELLRSLQQCDLLVNPRRLDSQAAAYSFPSKLLEYMALGVPTVSTPLPSIPPDLSRHLIIASADGEDAIGSKIVETAKQSEEALAIFAASAQLYVGQKFSTAALGALLRDFV
jgi:glycosyltransferase involved in cell wall biosynthesis